AAGADARLVDAGLRDEEVERRIDVAGPLLLVDPLTLGRRQVVGVLAAALAESPVIERDRVEPARGELLADVIPGGPLAIAHVQQDDAGAGLAGGEVGGLQSRAVRR